MVDGAFVQEGQLDRFRPVLNVKNRTALGYWNQLRGLDWLGLLVLLSLDPVDDVRGLIWRLCLIRDSLLER